MRHLGRAEVPGFRVTEVPEREDAGLGKTEAGVGRVGYAWDVQIRRPGDHDDHIGEGRRRPHDDAGASRLGVGPPEDPGIGPVDLPDRR